MSDDLMRAAAVEAGYASLPDYVRGQTPPTDRPLTAGDVPLLREGDVLRVVEAGSFLLGRGLVDGGPAIVRSVDPPYVDVYGPKERSHNRPSRFTFVSRPATSAASEVEGDRIGTHGPDCWGWGRRHYECALREIDRLAALASPPVSAEGLEECDTCGRLKVMGCRCDYASPPVSERERELEGFLKAYDLLRSAWTFRQANALHGDNEKYRWACDRFDAAFDEADRCRALTAQPQEPV